MRSHSASPSSSSRPTGAASSSASPVSSPASSSPAVPPPAPHLARRHELSAAGVGQSVAVGGGADGAKMASSPANAFASSLSSSAKLAAHPAAIHVCRAGHPKPRLQRAVAHRLLGKVHDQRAFNDVGFDPIVGSEDGWVHRCTPHLDDDALRGALLCLCESRSRLVQRLARHGRTAGHQGGPASTLRPVTILCGALRRHGETLRRWVTAIPLLRPLRRDTYQVARCGSTTARGSGLPRRSTTAVIA